MVAAWIAAGGYVVVLVLGSLLASAFSGRDPDLKPAALIPVPVLVLLLLSLRASASRPLMHVTAVVLLGCAVWMIQLAEGKFDFTLTAPLALFAMWLGYYVWALWGPA